MALTGTKPLAQLVYEAYIATMYGKYPNQQAPTWDMHVTDDQRVAWAAAAQAIVTYITGK
jgi:hypothetical protein